METLTNFIVTDRQSFIAFIELFKQDLRLNPENWENKNLDKFLDAIGSYTEDIQGYQSGAGVH